MKSKEKTMEKKEKSGLFRKKKREVEKNKSLEKKPWKKTKAKYDKKPYTIEEMIIYDDIFDED